MAKFHVGNSPATGYFTNRIEIRRSVCSSI
jgi:hypothetical protein